MKLIVWGTLTSVGGNGPAMTGRWEATFIKPVSIQGVYGELYEVPDKHRHKMDSFESHFGYIRVIANVDPGTGELTYMYIHTPVGGPHYTGDRVKEARKDEEFTEMGPKIRIVEDW
jgi:hypothetical protein